MFKAFKEVGTVKALKFAYFAAVQTVYHVLIDHFLNLPQFRKLFLTVLGSKIGVDSIVMGISFINAHHYGFKGLKIGKKCFVADGVMLDLYAEIEFQDEVTIAQRAILLTHTNVGYLDHPLQKFFPKISKKVLIKNGSVIGAGAILLPGVTIGEESFVAAGSIVTKDVPPRTLVAGAPATFVRKIK